MNFVISNKSKKELFVSLFQVLKNCSSVISCAFQPECLHIQGMDKSHVCLYDVKIAKDWFDTYTITDTKKISFDSSVFHYIINTKSENQDLIVTLDTETEDTLHIQFITTIKTDNIINNEEEKEQDQDQEQEKAKSKKEGKAKSKKEGKKEGKGKKEEKNDFKKTFKMPLSEYEYEELNVPVVDYDAEFILSSKLTADIFAELSNFGNDIMVKCSEESIQLTTTGITGEMCVQIPIDDLSSYSIVEGEEVSLNYSLVYLNKMCVTNKLTNEIEFYLSNDSPMKISYSLGEDSILVFYMAPKSTF